MMIFTTLVTLVHTGFPYARARSNAASSAIASSRHRARRSARPITRGSGHPLG
jgi:hypothetical protein